MGRGERRAVASELHALFVAARVEAGERGDVLSSCGGPAGDRGADGELGRVDVGGRGVALVVRVVGAPVPLGTRDEGGVGPWFGEGVCVDVPTLFAVFLRTWEV